MKMKFPRMIAAVIAALALVPSLRAAEGGEILWWDVSGDSITLDNSNVSFGDLKVRDPGTGDMSLDVNAARIHYSNGTGTGTGYLDIYVSTDSGYERVALGSIAPLQGEYFSSLSSLTGEATTYNFVLELGNWTSGTWLTGMVSGEMTYADLLDGNHIAKWDGITSNYATPWAPTAYSVPEPSSGLLLLIGGASLLLRRRRKKA